MTVEAETKKHGSNSAKFLKFIIGIFAVVIIIVMLDRGLAEKSQAQRVKDECDNLYSAGTDRSFNCWIKLEGEKHGNKLNEIYEKLR
jgi:hypothetical protein